MYPIKQLKKTFNKLFQKDELNQKLEELKIINSKILINQNKKKKSKNINDHEFSVFSQFGEDGIIQFLINSLENVPKTFVEFGVENYIESNTRFLLTNNNWKGLVLDADQENINQIKESYYFWKYGLTAENKFINIENINEILYNYLKNDDLGILSIDIDGNDYWILEKINLAKFKPVFIICEYNSLLGKENSITIPYNKNFIRKLSSHEKFYYGASIKAICNLADKKGYSLLGSNSNGNNLFFVNKNYSEYFDIKTFDEAYVQNSFKEYLNLDFNEAQKLLKDKVFFDVKAQKLINF
jgi:hypothetical protein